MAKDKNPSDVRFGAALMRLRKREGRTQAWLAQHLGCSPAHIGNVENGHCTLHPARVEEADNRLSGGGALARQYKELYQPEMVDWLDAFHELQMSAQVIREYQATLLPGPLQTADYARAVIKASAPWFTANDIEERVALREARSKSILAKEDQRYYVVLDDAVVLRAVAPPDVMAEQFSKVVGLMESGRIMLQVYAWGQLPQLGLGGPFTLLSSSRAPDVLHSESLFLGQATDEPGRVRQYGMLFSELQAMARAPGETMDLLKKKAEECR